MKLLDKSINKLSERTNKLDYQGSIATSDNPNYWKGRKIIPLDKWLKITKANIISRKENYNVKEGLQYIPNEYFEWMFPLGGITEGLMEEANKWYSYYIDLMERRRNPRYGRTKYFPCLLSPDKEDSALFNGLNKVIARALEDRENYNNSKKDNSSSSNNPSSATSIGTSIYPCKVLNRYACPYDNKGSKIKADANFDVDDLFALYKLAFQVEFAFAHAYSMSKSNETIYEADFEAGKVKEIYSNYHGNPHSFSTEYPLEEKLKEVKGLSQIPIRNVQDVYNALTDRETFNKVLEEELEDKEYQRHRDELVNLFMGIKDKIKIEDLTLYEPIFMSNIQKSKCSICNEFANIHCINCCNNDNVWLCVDHWKQHKKDKHNAVHPRFEKSITTLRTANENEGDLEKEEQHMRICLTILNSLYPTIGHSI